LATDADIERVRKWLEEEEQLKVHGNFLCNWDVIAWHHDHENVLICTDESAQLPVGFLAGGLTKDGILQVRGGFRRRGIGRLLVEHALAACAKGTILMIRCAPPTSVPFWREMGFSVFPPEERYKGIIAYRVLPLTHELPIEGACVNVTIRFFSRDRLGSDDVPPIDSWSPRAVQTSDGTIHLGERILMVGGLIERVWADVVVEILVAGQTRYMGKAKYAEDIGVVRMEDDKGYQMDQIVPGEGCA
jgi:GNAT superfamily N-acetyltransferase